jgi:hypothetical protein
LPLDGGSTLGSADKPGLPSWGGAGRDHRGDPLRHRVAVPCEAGRGSIRMRGCA